MTTLNSQLIESRARKPLAYQTAVAELVEALGNAAPYFNPVGSGVWDECEAARERVNGLKRLQSALSRFSDQVLNAADLPSYPLSDDAFVYAASAALTFEEAIGQFENSFDKLEEDASDRKYGRG